MRGYKPKDAAELVLQEMAMESGNDPKVVDKAHIDAEGFPAENSPGSDLGFDQI